MPTAPAAARSVAPALLLAAATLAAHANVLANGFAWDDGPIIVQNPDTSDLSRLGHVLLSPDMTRPYYRPLTRASYLLDFQLFGLDARGFHAVSLLVHLASVLALFALARRLLDRTAPALLAALLLALHPVHVEAVAFVSARNNLLALLFSLFTALLLMRAVERRRPADAWLSAVAFFLGMASKETGAMVLPVLAAWLSIAPRGRELRLRGLPLLAPHLLALAAYLVLRWVSLGSPAASDPVWPGLMERLARNYYVIPTYIRLLVFPDPLTIFHEVPAGYASLWWLPLAWLLILGLLAYLVRRPSPASTFGLTWFALNLVPVLGVVPLPTGHGTVIAERFVHMSAVGAWLVVADLAVRAAPRLRGRTALAAAWAVLVILGARTWRREMDWRNDLTLFESAVRANPRSVVGHFDLGVELKDRGDLDGARREWEAALAVDPGDPGSNAQLGTLAAMQGRYGDAERHYRLAIARDPQLTEAWLNLGRIYERTGRPAEAAAHYAAVLRNPDSAPELVAQARAALQRLGTQRPRP